VSLSAVRDAANAAREAEHEACADGVRKIIDWPTVAKGLGVSS